MSRGSFSAFHPRALPIPPLLVTFLPPSHFSFPFSPIQFRHFPLPVASCLPFPCPWPRASSLAFGIPLPLLRFPRFSPPHVPELPDPPADSSLYIMLQAAWLYRSAVDALALKVG